MYIMEQHSAIKEEKRKLLFAVTWMNLEGICSLASVMSDSLQPYGL